MGNKIPQAAQHELRVQMRRDLPFKIKPKTLPMQLIGDEQSGVLEVPLYGALTVGENLDYLTLVKRGDMKDLINRSKKLTQDVEIAEVSEDNIEDAFKNVDLAIVMTEYNIEVATIIMSNRVMKDASWSVDDTKQLHQSLLTGLVDVFNAEQKSSNDKSKEAKASASAEGEDIDPTLTQSS